MGGGNASFQADKVPLSFSFFFSNGKSACLGNVDCCQAKREIYIKKIRGFRPKEMEIKWRVGQE